MSLTLAMSTNLNRDICVDMAVSSKIENVSNTASLHQQTSVFHNHDGDHCCGLPYQDHNYGAPPPPPTPPLSPNAACFKPLMSAASMVCVSSCPTTVSPPPSVPTNAQYQNGLDGPCDTVQDNASLFTNSIVPESGSDVTRCICGFTHDDGYMICCDRCSVWQHIDCMNIDRNNIPDTYLCDRCNPRQVDKDQAFLLQSKKKEDLSMTSELDSDIDSGEENKHVNNGIQYTSVQSTPTSLTITSNRNGKKCVSHVGSGKKRKRSKDDSKKTGKRFHPNDKKVRSRSKSSCQDSSHEDILGSNDFYWDDKLREWSASYIETDTNRYTPELQQSVLSASKKLNEINHDNSILYQLHKQLAKVQRLKNCVMAMEDINISMPVAEVKGVYMLSNQFEGSNSFLYRRHYPHVFYYTGFDGLEICVDARYSGNITRFMRRSCQPNSEVKHVMENDHLHLFVFTKEHIGHGEEVTIPFDFKYQNCAYNVECCCKHPESCPVFKSSKLKAEMLLKNGSKLLSPSSLPHLSYNGNGYNSSDHESSHSYGDAESEDVGRSENQRKKSREERKMEAYIKAFAKMEKQEKKKESHHNLNVKADPITQLQETVKTPILNGVVVETPEESFNQSHNVTPKCRTNRRRSTRGGRRNVKRGRMTSFEGVLSPGVAMETDSNHSSDHVTATSNMTDRVASMDSEQSNLSSSSVIHDMLDETTQFSEPGNVAGDFYTETRISESSDVISSEEIKTEENKTVELPSIIASNVQTDQAREDTPLQPEVENICEETSSPSERVNSNLPAPETTVASTSSKVTRNKRNGSSEGHNTASTNNRNSTPPNDSIPLCSFVPWDYRPGIPSGHVKISINSLQERRCSDKPKTFIKKHWLRKAIEEDLLSKESSTAEQNNVQEDMEITNDVAVHSYKKKILKSYATAVVSDDVLQNHNPSSPNDEPNVSLMAENSMPHPASVESVTSVPLTENSDTPDTMDVKTTGLTASENHPALEYENLSDDEENNIGPDLNKPPAQTTVSNNSECSLPNTSNWNEHSEVAEKLLYNENAVLLEEAQTAPTKKKVSLQEYLKRSKDVRKNSGDSETTTVVIKPTTSNVTKAADSANIITPSKKPIHTVVRSISTPASLPVSAVKQSTVPLKGPDSTPVKKSVENLTKIITEAVKPTSENNQTKLSTLSSALSTGAIINTLPEEVMKMVTKTVKQLSNISEDTDNQVKSKNAVVKCSDTSGPKLKLNRKSSPAPMSSQTAQDNSRSPCARSNSSSTSHRARSGSSDMNKKSPFPNTQTHASSGSKLLQAQSSPVTPRSAPSPRSPRISTNSIRSPSTPTVYDHRHAIRVDSSKEPSSSRSRHNSGASSGSGSTKSTKSPRPIPTTDYHSNKHSTHPSSSSSYKHEPHSRSLSNQPQKVPSITPAVPAQPIPSLIRGPGSAVAQVVYNNRPAPTSSRLSQSSPPPPWEDYRSNDHLDRPPKDPPYSRPPYYPPPEPVGGTYRRNSYDKPYYDRYPYPYPRRDEPRDDYPPPKHSPPPPSYYHHSPYYAESKSGYYPPRDSRPISPGPPHRHRPPDFYAPKRKVEPCYRTNFYAPDMHRR